MSTICAKAGGKAPGPAGDGGGARNVANSLSNAACVRLASPPVMPIEFADEVAA